MGAFLQNLYPRKQFYHWISQPNAKLRRGIKSREGVLAFTPLIQLKLTHKYIHIQGEKEQNKPSRGGAGKLDLSTKLFTAALSWISFHKSWNCTLGWLKENSFTQEPNTMVCDYTHIIWQHSTRTLWLLCICCYSSCIPLFPPLQGRVCKAGGLATNSIVFASSLPRSEPSCCRSQH